jgi:hypothetical protein
MIPSVARLSSPLLRASRSLSLACGLFVGLAACSPAPASTTGAAPADSATSALSSSEPSPEAPTAEILAAAKKVAECDWDSAEPKGEPKTNCDARLAWDKLDAITEGKADDALVALLDNSDPKLVYMGALGLQVHGVRYRTDPALAGKVLARLEAGNLSEPTTRALAIVAGHIDASKAGHLDRLKALTTSIKSPMALVNFVGEAQMANREAFFDTTVLVGKTATNQEVRHAALNAFFAGAPQGKEEPICELWFDAAKEKPAGTDFLQSQAAFLAAHWPFGCDKKYDDLLDLLAEKTKKDVQTNGWVTPLAYFVQNAKASAKQRTRALKMLETIASDAKNSGSARAQAMEAVAKADPKGAKAYLMRYQADKDEWMRGRAKAALKELEPKKDAPAGQQAPAP